MSTPTPPVRPTRPRRVAPPIAAPEDARPSVVAADVWDDPRMRGALATHDFAEVFRLLQRHGWSQRKIAAMTGQSQSEISEILSGGRLVSSYAVLVRMCDGLGLPRGWLGLAHVNDAGRGSAAPRVRIGVSVDLDAADDPAGWAGSLRQALALLERGHR